MGIRPLPDLAKWEILCSLRGLATIQANGQANDEWYLIGQAKVRLQSTAEGAAEGDAGPAGDKHRHLEPRVVGAIFLGSVAAVRSFRAAP